MHLAFFHSGRTSSVFYTLYIKYPVTVFVLHNNSENFAFNKNVEACALYTIPDTALQRNGKPVFIPDFAIPCEMSVHLAVRISRLGRTISQRFAHRYWDAATVVPHFVALEMLREAQYQGLPWSVATGFDASLAVGDFVAKDALYEPDGSIVYTLRTTSGEVLEGVVPDADAFASAAIARISKYYMVRNGDLVLFPSATAGCTPQINTHVEGSIAHQRVLAFNVK